MSAIERKAIDARLMYTYYCSDDVCLGLLTLLVPSRFISVGRASSYSPTVAVEAPD